MHVHGIILDSISLFQIPVCRKNGFYNISNLIRSLQLGLTQIHKTLLEYKILHEQEGYICSKTWLEYKMKMLHEQKGYTVSVPFDGLSKFI